MCGPVRTPLLPSRFLNLKMLHVLQLFCNMDRNDSDAVLSEKELSPLAGRRVLLAEDNRPETGRLSPSFWLWRYRTDVALNGQQACEKLVCPLLPVLFGYTYGYSDAHNERI